MPAPDAWSMQHPVAYTVFWVALIMIAFVPLSVRQYARATPK
jgi:ABC-2 type transport system permease protein